MVTEMEWKCCHGYHGEDCNDGPVPGSQISNNRPQPRPGMGGGSQAGGGAGQGVRGYGGGSSGSETLSGRHGGKWILISTCLFIYSFICKATQNNLKETFYMTSCCWTWSWGPHVPAVPRSGD